MEDNNGGGPSTREVEGEELDVDWLKLVRANHEVNIRVTDKVDLNDLPQECNLLAISNVHDLLFVGGNSDVRIHRLSDVMRILEESPKDGYPVSEPLCRLELPARPIWIRLAMGEDRLVVALEGGKGVSLWKIQDILSGNNTPYHSFTANLPTRLLDVLPNPAASSDQLARLVALLAPEGIVIVDIEGCMLAEPFAGPFTSACWSAKGKQIAVGTPSGDIIQYTPSGAPKSTIPPPPSLEQNSQPASVQWLENDIFQVSYALPDSTPEDPLEVYIITRAKSPQIQYTYIKFYDPLDTMGILGRSSRYRHYANLKSWGQTTRHLNFMISGLASSIGVIHAAGGEGEEVVWESLILEETGRGIMPVAKKGVRDDTSCLGLGVVLTSEEPFKRGMEGGVEMPLLPPTPRLLAFSQEGFLVAYDVVNPEGGAYPGMMKAGSASSEKEMVAVAERSTQVGTMEASGIDIASTRAEQSADTPTRPSTAAQSTTPSFGFSGFGTGAKPASFAGSTGTTFGTSDPSTPSAFRTSSSSTSAFGKPSTPSAFGASSTPTAFGSSAFGKKPDASSTPAFGSSGFGSSSFGQSTTPNTTPAKPAFGAPSTPSAFGQPAFGASSTPVAFGQSSFGGSTTPSAFGQSSFGTSSTSSAFGSSPKPSAFGIAATPSASGSASTPSAFASSSTSAVNPFGATSSPSAFGSSSKPSAFGTPPPSSPFGTSSTSSTTSGFGAFAASKPAASTAPTGFSFGGFAQSKGIANPFGNKGLGGVGIGMGNAFGQKSAFGGSAFGHPPSSGYVAPPEPSPSIESASHSPVKSDFGFGEFESTLDQATPIARPTIPAIDDSPPTSPILGAKSKAGVVEDDSPPTSPILGARSTVKAVEDDSPPNSPPRSSIQPASVRTPLTSSTASGFIKPATAFGGTSSGGFGAFGGQGATKSAFGTSSTPSPFATSSPSAAGQPTASGSAAFGKSSTPAQSGSVFGSSSFGKPSTPAPAFGSSGFGKPQTVAPSPTAFRSSAFSNPIPTSPTSSPPSSGKSPATSGTAFGQSSVPSGAAFGSKSKPTGIATNSISGGFGGFAAPATPENGKTTSGGFGAFAAKSDKAAFGGFGGSGVAEGKKSTVSGFGGFAASPAKTTGGGFAAFASASTGTQASIFESKEELGVVGAKAESTDLTASLLKGTKVEEGADKKTAEEKGREKGKGKEKEKENADGGEKQVEKVAAKSIDEAELQGGFTRIEVKKEYDTLADGGPVRVNAVITASSPAPLKPPSATEEDRTSTKPEEIERDAQMLSAEAVKPRSIPLPSPSVDELASAPPERVTTPENVKAVPAMIPLPSDDGLSIIDVAEVKDSGGLSSGKSAGLAAVKKNDADSSEAAPPVLGEDSRAESGAAYSSEQREARGDDDDGPGEEEVVDEKDEQDGLGGKYDGIKVEGGEEVEAEDLDVEDLDDGESKESVEEDAQHSNVRRPDSIAHDATPVVEEPDDLLDDGEDFEDLGDEDEEEYDEDEESDNTEGEEDDEDDEDLDDENEEEDDVEDSSQPAHVYDQSQQISTQNEPQLSLPSSGSSSSLPQPWPMPRLDSPPVPSENQEPVSTERLLPPAFALKHAARKSSPLASQPPESGSSTTTPPASPAKPVFETFAKSEETQPAASSIFGVPAPNTSSGEQKKENPAPSMLDTGKQVDEQTAVSRKDVAAATSLLDTVKVDVTKPAVPAAPRPFNFFGTAATSSQPKPEDKGKASLASGLGLGKPPGAAPSQTSSPFSAWGQAVVGPSQASGRAGESGKSADVALPAPSLDTSIPPVQSLQLATDPSVYKVPTRPANPALPLPSRGSDHSLSAVMERMVLDIVNEIKSLKTVLANNAMYHQAMNAPKFVKVTVADFERHNSLPFSSLPDIASTVDGLIDELPDLRTDIKDAEADLVYIQSQMLRTDMKRVQAERFAEARDDSAFDKAQPERLLSIEQTASQAALKTSVQSVEEKLAELEDIVEGLKKRLVTTTSGAEEASSSLLQPIQVSVENVESAIRDRTHDLDDLAERISAVRLSSSSVKRQSQTAILPAVDTALQQPSPSRYHLTRSIQEPSREIKQSVQSALVSEDFWRQRFSFGKLEAPRISVVGDSSASSPKSRQTRAPIVISDQPIPYVPIASPKARVRRAVAKPSPPSISQNSLFGNVSISFDAMDLQPSGGSGMSSGSRGSGRAGGSSAKLHTPAPRFGGSSGAQPVTSSAPSTLFGGGFGIPKTPSGDKSKAAPPGFFSLTGFGDK